MVSSKPSTVKNQERIDLIKRFKGYGTFFDTNWNNIQKEINKLGVNESHWDIKYNTTPFGAGWLSYLEEDFEESGKDAETAEKTANDELEARLVGVRDCFSRGVVNFYSNLIKHETSNANVKTYWARFETYLNDTTNLDTIEKNNFGKDPFKKMINEMRTKATGTTPPPPPTGGDFENVGIGQRYYGDADLESVGFCMRYLKTN